MTERTGRWTLTLLVAVWAYSPQTVPAQWIADGAPICVAPSNQLTPAVVADGTSGVIAVWYDYRDGNADIYAQRVTATGWLDAAWPAQGLAVCTANGGQFSPVLVGDGAGGAITAWYDARSSAADVYAQRILSTGSVDPAWPSDGLVLSGASDDQIYPAIASNGSGGAYVTWRDYRGGPDTDIYVQQVLASGTIPASWPDDGLAVCTANGNQSVPAIVADGDGGAYVAWSDLRSDEDSDIYVQHVLSGGAPDPAWPSDGLLVCGAEWNQSGPVLMADDAGGALVAWFDYRSGIDADIYVQRVLASGAVDSAWPAGGRALCLSSGEQYSPLLAPDGSDGALVAWYDYRSGDEPDVYAHRILASGVVDPNWPVDGLGVCTAQGAQESPSLLADGTGGALVAWFDYRTDPASDIYAQRVLGDGSVDPIWPENGIALCATTGSQFSPGLASDEAGGAIVAWTDFRGGSFADVFAQRVYAGGGIVGSSVARAGPLRIRSIYPNPSRREVSFQIDLERAQQVRLEVFDAAGRRVRTVLSARFLPAGSHEFTWSRERPREAALDAGVYWVRVEGDTGSDAGRFVLLP